MALKSLEAMMGEMTDPGTIELNARYQNARDSVAWAWKIAENIATEHVKSAKVAPSTGELCGGMEILAQTLIPTIEKHLNRTLEVLNESKPAKLP